MAAKEFLQNVMLITRRNKPPVNVKDIDLDDDK